LPAAAESTSGGRAGAKTIFGMPQSEIAAARAAAEAIMQAQGVGTPAPPDVAPPPVVDTAPVAVPPAAAPAALAASRASATKTMFGVPAPELPQGFAPVGAPLAAAPGASARANEPALSAEGGQAAVGESDTAPAERISSKTGARKVAVPAPAIGTATIIGTPAAAAAKESGQSVLKDVGRTTQFGFEARPSGVPKKVDPKSDKSEKTKPVRAPAPARQTERSAERQGPLWTYVGVGFAFGLALLGIYQLVGRLAH
jgi:hypothetical protein